MAFIEFPGTDYHDINLDWLLSEMKELLSEMRKLRDEWEEWLRTHQYPERETPIDAPDLEVDEQTP